jgi:uncharacterized repeat protein (TIGR02543 family)
MWPLIKNLKTLLVALALLLLNYTLFAVAGTVVTVTYNSSTQNTECTLNIYLPAGYIDAADSVNSYPVFYLIHGGGENYTHWVNEGKANTTLDSYIENGTAVPMILVMPDGKNLAADIFSNELINDIIPFIESNYRVKTDKDNRGVGGLSWGGLQALEPGLYHYEMFGYIAILSSGWFTTETATYNRATEFLNEHGSDIEKSVRYFYFGDGMAEDIAYQNGLATMQVLKDGGLTVHYWQHPSGHWWGVWREDFKAFAPFLFRDSSTVYISLDFKGGNVKNSTVITHVDSTLVAPATPTRTGYTFADWYKETNCINIFDFTTETINKNTTIFANWNINSYKVNFESNGGTELSEIQSVNFNSLITAPVEPQKTNFIFNGWYTNNAFTKKWDFSKDLVTKDLTLYAEWISATGAIDENKTDLLIYPNPAKNVIKLANIINHVDLKIFDLNGKLLIQKQNIKANHDINVSELPQGIYLVNITNENSLYSNKIVIN